MKDLSLKSKIYLIVTYLSWILVLGWNLKDLNWKNIWMLIAMVVLASLACVLKVEGSTRRSQYSINFLFYGFTFFYLGAPEVMLVILISNLVTWFLRKLPWYIAIFNATSYMLVMQATAWSYDLINPTGNLNTIYGVLGITISMLVFTMFNHVLVGIVVWLARGETFRKSGVFDILPLMIDLTLLCMGASLVLVWTYNPYAILLFLIPLYLIYSTLRMPALERQTETDAKTGIYNNRYFEQQLESEISRANRFDRPLAIIMADLDLLRNINNTYGHLAGDEVLIGIARILKQSVREYDVVARFGGEEFAILMPETNVEQAFDRAEFIRRAIEKADFLVPTSVTPIKATMSFGVAGREGFNQTGKEIIHNADTALYHSKLRGRNRTYAYTEEAYESFFDRQPSIKQATSSADKRESLSPEAISGEQVEYKIPQFNKKEAVTQDASKSNETAHAAAPSAPAPHILVDLYIILIGVIAFGLFTLLFKSLPALDWLGLIVFTLITILTEWFSIDLYVRDTSISTSAAPILAGILLFGPFGALVLSIAFALTALLKHRGPLNRFIFNTSNQLLAAMLYLGGLTLAKQDFISIKPILQLIICLTSALIVYISTTMGVAVGMGLNMRAPIRQIWKEQFSWLAPYYLVMGLIAYALIFGFQTSRLMGTFIILAPLLFLRYSQKQYIDRTKTVVNELREKNLSLQNSHEEIEKLNEGLLEMLAEVIDLRDPYVLGHSRNVTNYAVLIAKEIGLNQKQVDLVRKAGLLHDVGKLGISETLLSKPAKLTKDEFDMMKRHVIMGGALLEKSPSLHLLIPIVKYHHEYYDGTGYPEGLKGNQIPVEARIVAVADAIEAMASDRPYRKAFQVNQIVNELRENSGTQFDPFIVDVAIKILRVDHVAIPSRMVAETDRMVL